MAKYEVTNITDKNGDEFVFREGVKSVSALPSVANAVPGTLYKLSTDSKIYCLSSDGADWVTIDIPVDSALSATSTNPVQNKAINAAISESNFEVNSLWAGGRRSSYSPIENGQRLQNALGFPKDDAVKVEYSTDGGATWLVYDGLTNADYRCIFSGGLTSKSVYCGANTHVHSGCTNSAWSDKAHDLTTDMVPNQMLRISICCGNITKYGTGTFSGQWAYCRLRRVFFYVSTQSARNNTCLFEGMTTANFKSGTDTWTSFGEYLVEGDSGWNGIPCNNSNRDTYITFGANDSQYCTLRWTIHGGELATTPHYSQTGNLSVQSIGGLSDVVWSKDSLAPNMMDLGIPYVIDANNADVYFYGKLYSKNNGNTASRVFDASQTIPLANGGTGASTAATARSNLGLGTLSTASDASTDGKSYLRKDGAWTEHTSDVFYGSNASNINDITTAYNDGKAVFIKAGSSSTEIYPLIKYGFGTYTFGRTSYGTNSITYTLLSCAPNGGTGAWTTTSYEIQPKLSNTNAEIQGAVSAAHSHSNKDTLDTITSEIKSGYDSHLTNTTVHVSDTEKNTWNGKQDKLTEMTAAEVTALLNELT